jgi:hypothetical protein
MVVVVVGGGGGLQGERRHRAPASTPPPATESRLRAETVAHPSSQLGARGVVVAALSSFGVLVSRVCLCVVVALRPLDTKTTTTTTTTASGGSSSNHNNHNHRQKQPPPRTGAHRPGRWAKSRWRKPSTSRASSLHLSWRAACARRIAIATGIVQPAQTTASKPSGIVARVCAVNRTLLHDGSPGTSA